MRRRLFPAFKAKAGRVARCPSDPESPVDFDYSVKDLEVLTGYVDARGRQLVAVGLAAKLNGCDGPTEPAWWANWFLVRRKGEAPALIGDGLWLVDAGDYDHDGRSEVLFWFSGYNRDGYVLYADDFGTRVEYLWNYH
jgi:hypothetical protein